MRWSKPALLGLGLAVGLCLGSACQVWAATASGQLPRNNVRFVGLELPHIPNPFEAIGKGVKKVADGVASLVTPKKSEPEPSHYYPPQGSKKQTAEKKSLFGWLKPAAKPKKTETISDWLGKEPLLP